jgi:tetratricopeptide (TPR) repeat protein
MRNIKALRKVTHSTYNAINQTFEMKKIIRLTGPMDIESFYLRLLQVSPPWNVKLVAVEDGTDRVEVHLDHPADVQFPCPECYRLCKVHGKSEDKVWRHLDTCLKPTFVHASLPVIECPEHGKRTVCAPWADPNSSLTAALEQQFAELASELGVTKAARILKLDREQTAPLVLRKTGKRAKQEKGIADGPKGRDQDARARQLSLFAKDDVGLVNEGIRALKDLQLEKALDVFHKHQKIYPKGYDVSPKIALTEFLLRKSLKAPSNPADRAAYFCHLWDSLEIYGQTQELRQNALLQEMKTSFFEKVVQEMEEDGITDIPLLPGNIPTGYIFLQVEHYDQAIRSLQLSIAEASRNASLYGYLGDAVYGLGNATVARQYYRDGCLIDPLAMDWRCLKDEELKELKEEIAGQYGFDEKLTLVWLPSHARIIGLFEPKLIHMTDGLNEMVGEYLAAQKSLSKEDNTILRAKLFFKGITLCDNGENLRFIKKIHLAQVRKNMQQDNPSLFAEYLEKVVPGTN